MLLLNTQDQGGVRGWVVETTQFVWVENRLLLILLGFTPTATIYKAISLAHTLITFSLGQELTNFPHALLNSSSDFFFLELRA